MRAGELAAATGVSTDTLRHYERKGLLVSDRAANGYREYSLQAPTRVRLVRHALSVGFSLDELARFLAVRDRGGAPCRQVRALAERKLEDLETRIRALQLLRRDLQAVLRNWDARLARTKKGERAWLLESLADGGLFVRPKHPRKGKRK